MKLLIVSSYYLPNISGITIYIKTLVDELAKKGRQITIVTSRYKNSLKKNEKIGNNILLKRYWTPIKIGKGIIMPSFPILVLRDFIKADIVNCHLPSLESFWIGFWSLFIKKRIIVTYHCDFDSGSVLINKLINLFQKIVLDKAETIIVNTRDYIEGYDLLKKYRNKIKQIYPPVKINKVNKKFNGQIKAKLKDKFVIGFLGRISKEKNIELLLSAVLKIKKSKKIILLIAGPKDVVGEKKYKKKIDEYLKKYKKIIYRIGELDEVSTFMKMCDCLVLPSNNKLESFGMVQVEAIKNGTPIVVANNPGIREVVKKTKMGEVFETNNVEDLSQKILKVLTKGKNFYQKNKKNILKFDYRKSVAEYIKTLGWS